MTHPNLLSFFKRIQKRTTSQFQKYYYRTAFDDILYRRSLSAVLYTKQSLSVDFSTSIEELMKENKYLKQCFLNKEAPLHRAYLFSMKMFDMIADVEYHFVNQNLFYTRTDFNHINTIRIKELRNELITNYADKEIYTQNVRIMDKNGSELLIQSGKSLIMEYMHTGIVRHIELICNQLYRPITLPMFKKINITMS
ncbi:MAG: hypothetical protein LC101_06795 [Flavobacteriales bacterium]|nr:hypothetical protein [Flavobacteriales bacterium]